MAVKGLEDRKVEHALMVFLSFRPFSFLLFRTFDDGCFDVHNITECTNSGMVSRRCKEPDTQQGPAVVRTPNGLLLQQWDEGLKVYAEQAARLSASSAQK